MKARIIWAPSVRDVASELPTETQEIILEKLDLLETFPRLYQVCEKGRFRRCRRFVAEDWVVYYRVIGNTVYVRGLWPARIP